MFEEDSNISRFTVDDILKKKTYRWQDKRRKTKFFLFTNDRNDTRKWQKRLQLSAHEEERLDADLDHLLNSFVYNYIEGKDDYRVEQKLTRKDLLAYFDEFKKDNTLKNYDCFFFFFLTFQCGEGSKEKGLHCFNDKVNLEELYKRLDEVPDMRMKPKVFLVQADSVSLLERLDGEKSIKEKGTKLVGMRIPHDADRITVVSSVPSLQEGGLSPMIQAFTQVIEENDKEINKRDFFSLTGLMNKKVEAMIKEFRKKNEDFKHNDLTVPLVTSTLTKQLLITRPTNDNKKATVEQ